MITDTEGLVLRQVKAVNGRRMIVILTKRYGKISAGTSISEGGKNKTALALRPFTYGRYELFKGRDTYSINGAETLQSFYAIGEDVDKYMAASYALELTDALALYTVHKAVWTTDIYGCEKFVQLKQARLDKIEADKRAAEQRRKELTLLIPLTEREKEFYGTLERIEDKNDYWRLRFRIMNMFQRMPNEERFCFIVLHAPRRTKLTPVSKYSPAKYEGGDMREFSREDFDLILLDEISRKLPVRN